MKLGRILSDLIFHQTFNTFKIMRKIERQMNEAVTEALNWKSGNTEVKTDADNISSVFLHGNHIATIGDNFIQLFDGGGHQTATTKSRLNALLFAHGVDDHVFQKNFEWFVSTNGETVKFTPGMTL
jgi:hypothetical protein